MAYESFKSVWEHQVIPKIPHMMSYENSKDPYNDYSFSDATLDRIASCSDGKAENFWASVHVVLSTTDKETGEEAEPLTTRYFIQTTQNSVDFINDEMNESFSELWELDEDIEYVLVAALMNDMVELNEYCLQGLTKPTFSIIFEKMFLNVDMFSDEAKAFYYDLFDYEDMISEEARDVFLF